MKPGAVVGEHFEIEAVAGEGGMGVVWRARDRRSGAPVALKVASGLEGERHGLAAEAEVLAQLRHPGIVRYLAHGETPEGEEFLAMEWLEGEDLDRRLARGPLDVPETIALGLRIAEALAAAHAAGIVHRDVKPANLFLVDGDLERVKVLDFGVARRRGRPRADSRTGVTVGTPGYMAPEQAGGARDVGPRADVFALGCVLYECLAGRPAFAGEHVMALLAKILLEDAPRVREARPDAPRALDELVAHMTSKAPEARPADGAAVAAALASMHSLDRRITVAPGTVRSRALTAGEQRLYCVVLIAPGDQDPDVAASAAASAGLPEAALAEALARFEGRVERLEHGLVVALAGVGAATDQAARAARCALAARAAAPGATVALATGRGLYSERWPVGEAIDRAARLLRYRPAAPTVGAPAGPGDALPGPPAGVRVDDVTAGLLDPRFDVRGDRAGLVLLGEREVGEGARTLLGRATPCVGRERELGLLAGLYDECVAEPIARAVVVTGPAGVGKSRLLHELRARLAARDDAPAVWSARGDPMSAGAPFGLLGQLLRGAAGILGGEPAPVRQQKLRARCSRHLAGERLARVAEFLCELVGAPLADDAASVQLRTARQDPILMGDQMRRAWEDLLSAECVEPLVIVLEDLHWGDLPTVKFIDAALQTLHERPLMVLAFARPEVRAVLPGLWEARAVSDIRLGELTRRAAEKLVRQVLGAAVPAETVSRLCTQAAGNAFYLEELIRASAEGKDQLPGTVLAMVQARLGAFEADARRVLRAGSVFGQVFWRGGVTALLGGDAELPVDAWLAMLVEREVVTARDGCKFPGEQEYSFRHALVRDAAYSLLTDEDRALGHRLAAAWLEAAGEPDAATLAEHFERGGEPGRAVLRYLQAAEQCLQGNDLAAAIDRAARGIACGAEGSVLAALRLVQAEAHRWRGELADAEAMGLLAMRSSSPGSPGWFSAAGEVVSTFGALGSHERLVSLVHELGEHSAGDEMGSPEAIALARAANQLLLAGHLDLADALLQRVDSALAHEPLVTARLYQARALWAMFRGDAGECLRLMEVAAIAFEHAGDLRNACTQQGNVGFAHLEIGQYAEAERELGAALASAERQQLANITLVIKHNLGLALAHLGQLEEARRVEADAAAAFAEQGDKRMEGAARTYLSAILTLAGDLDAAEREARAAAELVAAAPPTRAFAIGTLARVRLRQGAADDALALASEAMALLEALGGVEGTESLIPLVHAEALAAVGRVEESRLALEAARARLLARADKIKDPGRRASFLERVPENARTMSLSSG